MSCSKVLIDYTEYNRLKSCEVKYNEALKRLENQPDPPPAAEPESEPENEPEPPEPEPEIAKPNQKGHGNPIADLEKTVMMNQNAHNAPGPSGTQQQITDPISAPVLKIADSKSNLDFLKSASMQKELKTSWLDLMTDWWYVGDSESESIDSE